MCHLQKLTCLMCKLKQAGKTGEGASQADEPDYTFILQPCNYFKGLISQKKELIQGHSLDGALPQLGERFHCPNTQWPPDGCVLSRWICEDCLGEGYQTYRQSSEREAATARREFYRQYQQQHHQQQKQARRNRALKISVNTQRGKQQNQAASPPAAAVLDPFRHLPESFQLALGDWMKEEILRIYTEDYDEALAEAGGGGDLSEEAQKEIDIRWLQRSSEARHRVLTAWIPRCNLCKTTMVMEDKGHGDDGEEWIADMEYEPNGVLWKWLFALACKGPLQTEIRTGFLLRPCQSCVLKEARLREQVCGFLQDSGPIRCLGWLVYSWLLSRGTGNFPMFDHAAQNLGYPDTKPPTLREIMGLMAASWKRVTGVAWEQVGDLEAPSACDLAVIPHSKPFLKFDDWPRAKRDIPLEARHTLSSLNLGGDQVEGQQAGDGQDDLDDVVVRGRKRARESQSPRNSWAKSRRLLNTLSENTALRNSMEKQSGLAKDTIDQAFQAIVGMLDDACNPPLPGAHQLSNAPLNVEIARAPLEAAKGNSKSRSKKGKTPGRLLVSVKGAFVDEDASIAARKQMNSLELNDPAAMHSTAALKDLPMMHTALPNEAGSSKSIEGRLKGKAKHPMSSDTHVHFAEHDHVFDCDNLFDDNTLGGDDAQPTDDEDAEELEIPELDPEEGAILQCDQGHWHLLDTGLTGAAAPGELIFLPLGISHAND
ncbi:uncharacterized protein JN550_006339 [Neoarthrinium moseri]|uniref:uncharacterized protein n=1 Tax=Neoarthrinium moseri TaxID=1658444 RepID=UPI001FDC1975|nr:uncharacterized protein JN550_006339 [Neoarthrinium moseri]KAI1868423.1 hypothetical protein JN550_006339 [Neoarthrinium moseri]